MVVGMSSPKPARKKKQSCSGSSLGAVWCGCGAGLEERATLCSPSLVATGASSSYLPPRSQVESFGAVTDEVLGIGSSSHSLSLG